MHGRTVIQDIAISWHRDSQGHEGLLYIPSSAILGADTDAGLDEVPMAYQDIEVVMRAQADLVEKMARFEPKLVRMAPAGERPED